MPWGRYYRYYPRRRRAWRRRFRKPIYNRFWRRKRHQRKRRWVRKRLKLPYLRLKEYNPPHIRKLKIKFTIPLFICTSETVSRNFSMYFYEIAPHYQPSGGGFSVICFTYAAMYQLFTKVLAFWTQSNDTLPLIRYTGCNIKLFNSYHTDYITTYHNCGPMKPNLITYNATHPHALQLNNRRKIMPCIKDRPRKRPYTKLKIKPRSEMTNRWFFQSEINEQPLLILQTSAMSLDRMFANSNSLSTTIGFTSINTEFFQFHNFKLESTQGYSPSDQKWIWALENGTPDITKEKVINLTFLGTTELYTEGKPIKKVIRPNGETWGKTIERYLVSNADWGNPFSPKYLTQEVTVLYTNMSPHTLTERWKNADQNTEIGNGVFQTPTKPLLTECRYNPYADNGDNHIFLESINKREQHPWQQPTDPKLEGTNLPIWLSTFGFIDWQKNRLGDSADLDFVMLIVSNHITPKMGFYLPIDEDFLKGRSPFQPEETRPFITDQRHWQPKVRFQTRTINTIASCGPSTIKLPRQVTAEAHARCTFYFKLGGCAPHVSTIEDPKKQPTYPTPNNFLQQPSLQNPAYPAESFLYNFDYRRGSLTATAINRMLQISPTKTSYASITDSNLLHQTQRQEETSSSDDEAKTEKETLLQLLQKQRQRQQHFKQRILHLLSQSNLE
nr:MAG: ORF1 [TTV-like mini virus]